MRAQAQEEHAGVDLLQAQHVRVVPQQLLHGQRPPVLGRQPPAQHVTWGKGVGMGGHA